MNIQKYAPVALRLGLAFVFIWFGLNQLIDQSMWVSLIPAGLLKITGLSAPTFVILNGVFEVFMASLLAFGIRIRIVGTLLFLHMLAIVGDVGLSAIGVRDIGIMFGLLSVALQGSDIYSAEYVPVVLN